MPSQDHLLRGLPCVRVPCRGADWGLLWLQSWRRILQEILVTSPSASFSPFLPLLPSLLSFLFSLLKNINYPCLGRFFSLPLHPPEISLRAHKQW